MIKVRRPTRYKDTSWFVLKKRNDIQLKIQLKSEIHKITKAQAFIRVSLFTTFTAIYCFLFNKGSNSSSFCSFAYNSSSERFPKITEYNNVIMEINIPLKVIYIVHASFSNNV
jgi:hypothetical protein